MVHDSEGKRSCKELKHIYLVQQLLQFLLKLHKVPGGDQALLGLVQAVSGELHQLVLNESQHAISQGQGRVWGTLCDDVEQSTLHLGCRLGNEQDAGLCLLQRQQNCINNSFRQGSYR